MADEFEEEAEEEEEAEPDGPDLDEEDLDEDDEFASPAIGDDDEDILVGDAETAIPGKAEAETDDDEDESLDLEEDVHPDDVEEPLDVLLLERTSSGLLDEDAYDEDDDDVDTDDRGAEPGSRIPPKRPGEFVCRSCFLVKHPSQLADNERVLCADCV